MEHLITIIKRSLTNNKNKIAVIDQSGEYTFSNLEIKAKSIASNILSRNEFKRPIAVYLPKSYNALVSFVGIVFSGNFYVPLDTKGPSHRIRNIIDNLEDPLIITDNQHKIALIELGFDENNLIEVGPPLASESESLETALKSIENKIIDTDPVYIIYTSGSTGIPKGVIIPHRGVIDYIEWAIETFDISSKEHIGSQAPLYFDNSTLDVYLCLIAGATLNFIPENLYMFPIKLLEYINQHKINFVFWVPSVLQTVSNLDMLKSLKPECLNKILFAGEVMPAKHLNYWINHMPNNLYANLYGPTEITVDCTYYIVDRQFSDDESLPIGIACKNSDIMVLNDKNELVKNGEQGELCVRGSSLAHGYWNDPEKTDEAFTQNPLNNWYPEKIYRTGDLVYYNERNEIIFVGRKDNQIKLNGYRIELGEIENAAMQVSQIQNACILFDDKNKKLQLVYSSVEEISSADIRKQMLNFVPKYMLPSQIHYLNSLPLNSNGKVDRIELEKQFINE